MGLLQQAAQQVEQNKVNDVVAELRKRGVFDDRCPRCRISTNWGANFFQMPVAPMQAPGFYIAEQLSTFFPVVSFTCTNCGYMVYHNLKILGLDK